MAFEISFESLIFSDLMAATFGGLAATMICRAWGGRKRHAERDQRVFGALLDGNPDTLARIDADNIFAYASPASTRLLEQSPQTIVGRSVLSLVDGDGEALRAAFARARAGQSGTDTVFRRLRTSGEQQWIEARIGAADASGHLTLALRDISTRKTAELALRVANTELNKLAGSDALTGLANRRRFDQLLESECRRSSRHGKPVTLLLLDIDRFRSFNDRHGHQAGDACLRQIGTALRAAAERATDVPARFSGEEFALLLPGLAEEDGLAVAERIREAVSALGLGTERGSGDADGVTVSIGSATVWPVPDGLAGFAAALIAAADRALYDAKRMGRNRVASSSGGARPDAIVALLAAEPGRLARLETLRTTGALNPFPVLDRISRMAAVLLGMPMAFVALLDRKEVTILGSYGFDEEPLVLPYVFCTPLLGARGALVVPRTGQDPRFGDVAGRFGWASLAAAPLLSGDGLHHIGALWVVDRQAREPLDEPKRMLLTRLASLVMEDLDARETAGQTLSGAA